MFIREYYNNYSFLSHHIQYFPIFVFLPRLTDLSELIADYDATQKRDQEEIARLQKRVSSLESESSTEKRRSVSVSVNTNIVVSDLPTSPTTPTTPTSPTSYTTDIRPAPLQLVTKNRSVSASCNSLLKIGLYQLATTCY